ncbi:MAG: hypothetical protein J6C50_03535 [Rickettsiales bacterium]|nr:hypothetical protein [Rickettsiales bacterium]
MCVFVLCFVLSSCTNATNVDSELYTYKNKLEELKELDIKVYNEMKRYYNQILGSDDNTLIFFDRQKWKCITSKKLEIFQSFGDAALATFKQDEWRLDRVVVLLINSIDNYDKLYYDKEQIYVPFRECVKQVGIFNYKAKSGDYPTIPIVIIE